MNKFDNTSVLWIKHIIFQIKKKTQPKLSPKRKPSQGDFWNIIFSTYINTDESCAYCTNTNMRT